MSGDIKKMDFETAISELEQIVNNFESGDISLEESILQYTRAAKLKAQCEKKLSEAKLKVEKITEDQDGNITTQEAVVD